MVLYGECITPGSSCLVQLQKHIIEIKVLCLVPGLLFSKEPNLTLAYWYGYHQVHRFILHYVCDLFNSYDRRN